MKKEMYLATMIKSKKGTFWAVGILKGDVNSTWVQIQKEDYDDVKALVGTVVPIECVDLQNGRPVYEIILA